MDFYFAQAMGLIALIVVSIGYFLKDLSKFLVTQAIVNFFYAIAFLIVQTYVGATIFFISFARCLYLVIAEKKEFKYTNHCLFVFILLYIVATIVFWSGWIDIFPLVACSIFTFGFAIKQLEFGRIIFIIANLILMAYNIISQTYISAISSIVEAVVVFLSIFKLRHDEKMKRK